VGNQETPHNTKLFFSFLFCVCSFVPLSLRSFSKCDCRAGGMGLAVSSALGGRRSASTAALEMERQKVGLATGHANAFGLLTR
jgi:hypothetical protein